MLKVCTLIISFIAFTTAAFAQESDPTGFGVQLGMSNLGFQAGPVYRNDTIFAAMSFNGITGTYGGSSLRNLASDVMLAYDVGIGSHNHLLLGVDWMQIWSAQQTGSSTNGSTEIGPMVGLQRFFPGTSFYVLGVLVPYQYNYFNGITTASTGHEHQFLANGSLMFGMLF